MAELVVRLRVDADAFVIAHEKYPTGRRVIVSCDSCIG